jgi:hypothetical protein
MAKEVNSFTAKSSHGEKRQRKMVFLFLQTRRKIILLNKLVTREKYFTKNCQ